MGCVCVQRLIRPKEKRTGMSWSLEVDTLGFLMYFIPGIVENVQKLAGF